METKEKNLSLVSPNHFKFQAPEIFMKGIYKALACMAAGQGLTVLKRNHFMIPRWPW